MAVTTQDGWLVGDAVPQPAEGLYHFHDRELGVRVFMPARDIVARAFLSRPGAQQRCPLCREAAASYSRSLWGPSATGLAWRPTSSRFDPARPAVEALLSHAFWGRIEVVGSLVHIAQPRREAATTVDIAVRLSDGGLALLAIWSLLKDPEPPPPGVLRLPLVHPQAPWAELGAAVAAMADSGIPLEKAGVVWVGGDGEVRLEARPADDALALWVDALDLARWASGRAAEVQHASR
jgi:hypothetical protein